LETQLAFIHQEKVFDKVKRHTLFNTLQKNINCSLESRILDGIEINDDTVLNTLLFADDQLLCQTQKMIYREYYMLFTSLQNNLECKYHR